MQSPKKEVYWFTLKKPETVKLQEDLKADVLIIGGGMGGLTVAENLKDKGMSIAIVERDFCGGGASGKSSGFITPDSELEFFDLVNKYGETNAKKLWDFARDGVEEIKKTIKKYSIDCDFEDQDSFFIANSVKDFAAVKDEHEQMSKYYSVSSLYPKEKVPEVLGSKKYFGAIRYKETFGIVSYLYCLKLKEELQKSGVKIFEGTGVEKIEGNKVWANGKLIEAKKIVVCIDHFLPSLGIYPKDAYHAQTFLTISKPLTDEEVRFIFPKENLMVWDTDLIYQYYRVTRVGGEKRLLFGASSLLYTYLPKTKRNFDHVLDKIEKYQKDKFSRSFEVEYVWPGLIGVSKDFLPLAGQHQKYPHIYYVSGCAGLPWTAASAKYIAQKLMNGRNELDRFFKAGRKYPVRNFIQTFITKPIAFAISHGLVKYFNQ